VGGAGVSIIGAIEGGTRHAGPVGAKVPISAGIIIGTIDTVVDEDTADVGITAIISAWVVVATFQGT